MHPHKVQQSTWPRRFLQTGNRQTDRLLLSHHGHVGVVLHQLADDHHLGLEVVRPHVSDLDEATVGCPVLLGACIIIDNK